MLLNFKTCAAWHACLPYKICLRILTHNRLGGMLDMLLSHFITWKQLLVKTENIFNLICHVNLYACFSLCIDPWHSESNNLFSPWEERILPWGELDPSFFPPDLGHFFIFRIFSNFPSLFLLWIIICRLWICLKGPITWLALCFFLALINSG